MENNFSRIAGMLPGHACTVFPEGDLDFLNRRWCGCPPLGVDSGFRFRLAALYNEKRPRHFDGEHSVPGPIGKDEEGREVSSIEDLAVTVTESLKRIREKQGLAYFGG